MKIISEQKDYYDGVQTYNDDLIIFLRKQKELIVKDQHKFDCNDPKQININEIKQTFDYEEIINLKENYGRYFYYQRIETDFKYFESRLFFIGFCGKIYIGIIFDFTGNFSSIEHPNQYCYTIEQFDKIFKKYTTKSEKKKYIKDEDFGCSLKNMKNKLSKPININNDLFFKYKTPCFVIIPSRWRNQYTQFIISPILKDYQFTKVFDPYTAFQEIEMFISGVLGESKETITIDDKSILYKKGFDNMSFKTYKGTKKPRRRNK